MTELFIQFCLTEAHPDRWFRETYYGLIDKSRESISSLINGDVSDIVLVENVSSAVNSILRSFPFQVSKHLTYYSYD